MDAGVIFSYGGSIGSRRVCLLREQTCGHLPSTIFSQNLSIGTQLDQAFSVCYAPGITMEKADRSIAPPILSASATKLGHDGFT